MIFSPCYYYFFYLRNHIFTNNRHWQESSCPQWIMKGVSKHRFFILRFGGPRGHSRPSRPSTSSWLDFSRFLRPRPQRDQAQWWRRGRWAGQRWHFAVEKLRLKVWWTWWCGIALLRQPMCVFCVWVCVMSAGHTHIHKQTHTHIILCARVKTRRCTYVK
jgi:hypothetical protein